MSLNIDGLKKYYIYRDKALSRTFNSCHFVLKHDYTNDYTLKRIESILEKQESSDRELIDCEVERPFQDYFFEILDEFDNDKLINLIASYYLKVEILKDKERTIEDCSSRVAVGENNQFVYSINCPEQEKDSGMLYAAYAHELIHFPQFVRKKNYEFVEYSEVLSMYFEYLMYEKMYPKEGKRIFINNRIKQLLDNKIDFENDLYYAKNNHLLNIPRDKFSLTLADYMSYYEGIEYVLSLIDYSKDNKKIISDLIYRVLVDETSMKEESNKLGIDPSNCTKILKMH